MGKKLSKVSEAILEMAGDQYRGGLMDKASHEKITVRLLGAEVFPTAKPISGERRFRWDLVPTQAGAYAIPPFSLPFFDPATHGYRRAASASQTRKSRCDFPRPGPLPEDRPRPPFP